MNKWDKAKIDRWSPLYEHSWGYRIFKQYDEELNHLLVSSLYSSTYTYSHLKSDGAMWDSLVKDYLNKDSYNQKLTIREWSNAYNSYMNWMRLSFLMSICSYFETYIASIIKECIESDPGLVYGCPHVIDGIKLKKMNVLIRKDEVEQKIISCTKGDWNSRIVYLQRLFADIPNILISSISDLEKIRLLRNDVGHAFGRDIENAHKYDAIKITPMRRISIGSFNKYRFLINRIVKELDKFLMARHIGNFEPLLHYYQIYESIKDEDKGTKMIKLKKSLGSEVETLITKEQCRGIIKYYEAL